MTAPRNTETPESGAKRSPRIRFGGSHLPLPRSRLVRMAVGVLLILAGLLGFLPVLGFWMIPLGVLVLSFDLPLLRRWRRRLELWWARRRERRKGVKPDTTPAAEEKDRNETASPAE